MAQINPYLTFESNCEEAFNFYRSVFGGEYASLVRMGDMDMGMPISDESKDLIMHVALPIGSNTLMGSDAPGECAPPVKLGNNFSVSVSADSKEDADRIYNGLSAGGSSAMPMADAPWGSYFGMLTDKFSVQWMVSFSQQTP